MAAAAVDDTVEKNLSGLYNRYCQQHGLTLAEAIEDDERLAKLGEDDILQEFREKVGGCP